LNCDEFGGLISTLSTSLYTPVSRAFVTDKQLAAREEEQRSATGAGK
jgi:hypothetical protein